MAHQQNTIGVGIPVTCPDPDGSGKGSRLHRYARAPGELLPLCDSVRAVSEPARVGVPASRILLIDDSTLQRENLATVLRDDASVPSVGWDAASVLEAVKETPPDIVLLSMMTRDSIGLLRLVRRVCPSARIMVIGIAEDDDDAIIECAEAGVAGYHVRTDSLDHLITLIARMAEGESACPTKVSTILLNHLSALAAQKQSTTKDLVLTAREMQILQMLESGRSNRDIADELCITLHTVKNHVHSVLTKLGASTRTEAAAMSRTLR